MLKQKRFYLKLASLVLRNVIFLSSHDCQLIEYSCLQHTAGQADSIILFPVCLFERGSTQMDLHGLTSSNQEVRLFTGQLHSEQTKICFKMVVKVLF